MTPLNPVKSEQLNWQEICLFGVLKSQIYAKQYFLPVSKEFKA